MNKVTEIEEWRPIVDYEGFYEVSNLGNLHSVDRVIHRDSVQGDMLIHGRLIYPTPTPKGYMRVQLSKQGRRRNHMVHVLVAKTFIPNPENKPEVNHDDGIKSNNKVGNLLWATQSENQQHAYDTGLKKSVVKHRIRCIELDIIALGTLDMERKLIEAGYPGASAAGVWIAFSHPCKHLGLTFESTLIENTAKALDLI